MKIQVKRRIVCIVLTVSIMFGLFVPIASFAVDGLFAKEAYVHLTIDENSGNLERPQDPDNQENSKNTEDLGDNEELDPQAQEYTDETQEQATESQEHTEESQEQVEPEESTEVLENIALTLEDEPTGATMFSSSIYPKTVYINNADELTEFLNGGRGTNADEYILTDNIDMSGRGPFRGRGGDVPFTGRFASEEGSRFTISNLALKGRDVAAETLGGNDIGFIRTAGGGAVIENVNFDGARYAEPTIDTGLGWRLADSHIGLVVGRVNDGTVSLNNIKVNNVNMTLGSTTPVNFEQTNTRIGGLIGSVEKSTTVTIANVSIDATIQMYNGFGTARTNRGGGLVGESAGDLTISNCEVNVDLIRNGTTGNFLFAGGVLGRRIEGNVEISDVVQNGNIEAFEQAGGIVGSSAGTGSLTLDRVATSVDKTFTVYPTSTRDNRLGGLVGSAVNNTTIRDSKNLSNIRQATAIDSDIGGLVGFAGGGIAIDDSENHGNLVQSGGTNNTRMAGIVARTENNVTLTNVINRGSITRTEHSEQGDGDSYPNGANNRLSSGILGSANVSSGENVTIANAVNYGNIPTRIKLSAGIAGRFLGEGNANVINSINHGDINTFERAGGIVGRNELLNLIIDGCINYGDLSASEGSSGQNMMGGILSTSQIGLEGNGGAGIRNVTIRNCANRGEIISRATGTGSYNGTGGIAGWIPNNGVVIENSYNIGHVRSTGNSISLGGIIGAIRWSNVSVTLKNVYSIGPVTATGTNPPYGNGILGFRLPHDNTGIVPLILENVYISTFFTGNAISDTNIRVSCTNVYIDRSTARTTDTSRLQTGLPGVTGVNTEELVSGNLTGLSGGPWMYGIKRQPWHRTLPYFAWQTGGVQQEQFFDEIYSTNMEIITGGANVWLRGIVDFALQVQDTIKVLYSLDGFDHNGVRVFNPNNDGAPHTPLGSTSDVRDIPGTTANIPSRLLTTGLISNNDVVAFDAPSGHRIYFDLNEGEQIDDIPLAQIISHGELAILPEVEREGYLFAGWNTKVDGTGTQYLPGVDIPVTEGATFYARWDSSATTLAISNEVTGHLANKITTFEFTIYFQDKEGEPLPGGTTFDYVGDTIESSDTPALADGELELDNDGSAKFRLAHGQRITITGVPANVFVQVIQTLDNNYITSFSTIKDQSNPTEDNDTTMLPVEKEGGFRFINERIYVPPTGISVGNIGALPLLAMIVIIPATLVFTLRTVLKKRIKKAK